MPIGSRLLNAVLQSPFHILKKGFESRPIKLHRRQSRPCYGGNRVAVAFELKSNSASKEELYGGKLAMSLQARYGVTEGLLIFCVHGALLVALVQIILTNLRYLDEPASNVRPHNKKDLTGAE